MKAILGLMVCFLLAGCAPDIESARQQYNDKLRARRTNTVQHMGMFHDYQSDMPAHQD